MGKYVDHVSEVYINATTLLCIGIEYCSKECEIVCESISVCTLLYLRIMKLIPHSYTYPYFCFFPNRIAHTFLTHSRRPEKGVAGMLLCAILSDTLNLQGPTTT